ncbi:MAG: hypothetical protein ACR2RE_16080 [Geminicoccaceae bacterium]
MNPQPLWAAETNDGGTMYQYRAREGSGVDEFIILWNHAKHTFEAVALFENEPDGPDFVFTRTVSPGAEDFREARILPAIPHYEPDRLIDVIQRFADLPPGLRAALVQDRNRAKLARRPIACTPDWDALCRAETRLLHEGESFRHMAADPEATEDAILAQRCRVFANGDAVYQAHSRRSGFLEDPTIPF